MVLFSPAPSESRQKRNGCEILQPASQFDRPGTSSWLLLVSPAMELTNAHNLKTPSSRRSK
jgi:hypothetical protein